MTKPTRAWLVIACLVVVLYALASFFVFKLNPELLHLRNVHGIFDAYLVGYGLLGLPLLVSLVVQACAVFDPDTVLPRWVLNATVLVILLALLNVLPFLLIGVLEPIFRHGITATDWGHC